MSSEDILNLFEANSKYRLPLDLIKKIIFHLPLNYLFEVFPEHVPFAGYPSEGNILVDEYFYQEYFLSRLPNSNIRILASIKQLNVALMSKIGLNTRWSGSAMEINPLSEVVETTTIYIAIPNHLDCKLILPKYKRKIIHDDQTEDIYNIANIYEDLNRYLPHSEKLVYAEHIKDCFAKHVMGIDTCSWSQFLEHLYLLFGSINELDQALDKIEKILTFGAEYDTSEVMQYLDEISMSDPSKTHTSQEWYEMISNNTDEYRNAIIKHITNPDVLSLKYHAVLTNIRILSYYLILGIIDEQVIKALVRMMYFHYHIEKNFNLNGKLLDILLY
jgi:hypothetical protein